MAATLEVLGLEKLADLLSVELMDDVGVGHLRCVWQRTR